MLRTLILAFATSMLPLAEQERAAGQAVPATPIARSSVVAPNADDVSRALLRFDRAWTRNPPAPERVAEINRRFDRACASLSRSPSEALRAIDDLACELDVGLPRELLGLRGEFDPPVGTWAAPSGAPGAPLRVRVVQLYPRRPPERVEADGRASEGAPRTLLFQLVSPSESSKVVAQARRATSELADGRLEFDARLDGLQGHAYVLTASAHDRNAEPDFVPFAGPPYWLRLATFHVRIEPASELRTRLEAHATGLQPTSAEMEAALAAFRSRLTRLDDTGSDARDTFSHDPAVALGEQLKRELAAFTEGRDPYLRRQGELWRTVDVDGAPLPVRIFAPAPARDDARLPLVVALHARGEDEDAFFEGYGVGRLVELARERGFVLAAPRVGDEGLSAEAFDALVTELGYVQPLDPARIVVLGNAEGGRAAVELASTRRHRIAGAACFATDVPDLRASAPLRVHAGALDPLVDAVALGGAVDAARGRGLPIELEVVADHGHALVASARLEAALGWLLARRLDESGSR